MSGSCLAVVVRKTKPLHRLVVILLELADDGLVRAGAGAAGAVRAGGEGLSVGGEALESGAILVARLEVAGGVDGRGLADGQGGNSRGGLHVVGALVVGDGGGGGDLDVLNGGNLNWLDGDGLDGRGGLHGDGLHRLDGLHGGNGGGGGHGGVGVLLEAVVDLLALVLLALLALRDDGVQGLLKSDRCFSY